MVMTRVTLALFVSMLSGALAPVARAQVADFEPVTTEELLAPDDADWINWRRTLNGQGYSPLDQIDRENVRNLQLVWSWAMQPGTDEVTPLVHDGVMYVPSRSGVQALDAATGDLLWEHSRRQAVPEDENLPINRRPGMARRSIAILAPRKNWIREEQTISVANRLGPPCCSAVTLTGRKALVLPITKR